MVCLKHTPQWEHGGRSSWDRLAKVVYISHTHMLFRPNFILSTNKFGSSWGRVIFHKGRCCDHLGAWNNAMGNWHHTQSWHHSIIGGGCRDMLHELILLILSYFSIVNVCNSNLFNWQYICMIICIFERDLTAIPVWEISDWRVAVDVEKSFP